MRKCTSHLLLLHCHLPSLPSPPAGAIKPPAVAKDAAREGNSKEGAEEVLPATGEEGQKADNDAVEEKVIEPPLQAEGENGEKDEATGERIEPKVERHEQGVLGMTNTTS